MRALVNTIMSKFRPAQVNGRFLHILRLPTLRKGLRKQLWITRMASHKIWISLRTQMARRALETGMDHWSPIQEIGACRGTLAYVESY